MECEEIVENVWGIGGSPLQQDRAGVANAHRWGAVDLEANDRYQI
jgi:hypothetical protein